VSNMVDFAADDAWIAAEHSGVDVAYTKSGEAMSNTLTLVITPRESRLVESNGFMFEVFRVHVSGETTEYDPNQGDRLVYGGKTWDYAGLSREAIGGMAHAFFESLNLQHLGVSGSPV
jgi:hypothetical protein